MNMNMNLNEARNVFLRSLLVVGSTSETGQPVSEPPPSPSSPLFRRLEEEAAAAAPAWRGPGGDTASCLGLGGPPPPPPRKASRSWRAAGGWLPRAPGLARCSEASSGATELPQGRGGRAGQPGGPPPAITCLGSSEAPPPLQ